MTKTELEQIIRTQFLYQPATFERLENMANLTLKYLASQQDEYVYLVTSENHDTTGFPYKCHLATLDENEAEECFKQATNMAGFGYAIYKIPLNNNTACLSDNRIKYER